MTAPVGYRERWCAFTPTATAIGGVLVAVVAAAIVLLALGDGWGGLLLAAGVVAWIGYGAWLERVWPLRIQVSAESVAVGGVGHRTHRRPLAPTMQAHGVCECAWAGVDKAEVITDPSQVAAMRALRKNSDRRLRPDAVDPYGGNAGAYGILAGVFSLWTASAAFVVHVDDAQARYPAFRQMRKQQVRTAGVWMVPTRHPESLRATLAELHRQGITVANGTAQTTGVPHSSD